VSAPEWDFHPARELFALRVVSRPRRKHFASTTLDQIGTLLATACFARERLLISPIVNIGSYRSIRVVSRLVEMNRFGVRNAPLDILA